jgi:hypothetical protein
MRLEEFGEHSAEDFGELLPAEVLLIRGIRDGWGIEVSEHGFNVIGPGLPPLGDQNYRVRAKLVRWLALGGSSVARTPERGLRIQGAWISGVLDLEGAHLPITVGLVFCRFDEKLLLTDASLQSLLLGGSNLPHLIADRLNAKGSVVLNSTTLFGMVKLADACIGGMLECRSAQFSGFEGGGLFWDRMRVCGSLFLNNARSVGVIKLSGVRVGGALDCDGLRSDMVDGVSIHADQVDVVDGFF